MSRLLVVPRILGTSVWRARGTATGESKKEGRVGAVRSFLIAARTHGKLWLARTERNFTYNLSTRRLRAKVWRGPCY